jgi:hypothetical protein
LRRLGVVLGALPHAIIFAVAEARRGIIRLIAARLRLAWRRVEAFPIRLVTAMVRPQCLAAGQVFDPLLTGGAIGKVFTDAGGRVASQFLVQELEQQQIIGTVHQLTPEAMRGGVQ